MFKLADSEVMQSHDASQKNSAVLQTDFRRLTGLQAIPGLQVSWCKLEVELTTPKSVLMASADGQPQNVPPLVVAALNLKTRFNAQVPRVSLFLCRHASHVSEQVS